MGKYTEFLYLNEEETIKAGVLHYAGCIDVEEEIFKLRKDILGQRQEDGSGYHTEAVGRTLPQPIIKRACCKSNTLFYFSMPAKRLNTKSYRSRPGRR